MLKCFHIHSFSFKTHPFQFQTCSLLVGRHTMQLYLAACAEDTMPRQRIDWVYAQKSSNSTMVARVACGCSNTTICAHFAGRY